MERQTINQHIFSLQNTGYQFLNKTTVARSEGQLSTKTNAKKIKRLKTMKSLLPELFLEWSLRVCAIFKILQPLLEPAMPHLSQNDCQGQSTVTLWPNFDFSFQPVTAAPLINYQTWRGRDNQQALRAGGLQTKTSGLSFIRTCLSLPLVYMVNKEAHILKTPQEHLNDDYLALHSTAIY